MKHRCPIYLLQKDGHGKMDWTSGVKTHEQKSKICKMGRLCVYPGSPTTFLYRLVSEPPFFSTGLSSSKRDHHF